MPLAFKVLEQLLGALLVDEVEIGGEAPDQLIAGVAEGGAEGLVDVDDPAVVGRDDRHGNGAQPENLEEGDVGSDWRWQGLPH